MNNSSGWGWRGFLLQIGLGLALLCHTVSAGNPQSWWIVRGVVDPNSASDDYAKLNVGQLKHMAAEGRNELNQILALNGGAGSPIDSLVNGWANAVNADDYALCTVGQLKAVAKLFWDRLIAETRATAYPWTTTTTDDDDYAIANVGQLKNLFNFGSDMDGDGIEDSFELAFVEGLGTLGGIDGSGNLRDFDGDGLADLEETYLGTDIFSSDTLPWSNYGTAPANTVFSVVRYLGPFTGLPVVFTANGGGKVSAAASGSPWQESVTVYADADGFARAYWVLGKYGSTNYAVTSRIASGQSVTFDGRSADLVARWKLDEEKGTLLKDSSGTGYNAGLNSLTPNPWDTSFDGSGSIKTTGCATGMAHTKIFYPNTENEAIGQSGPFSLSFWFKADTLTSGNLYWLAGCEQAGVSGFRLGIDVYLDGAEKKQSRVKFWTTESGGNVTLVAPVPIMEKRWYNLSIVHTGSETQIYIDWSLVASAPGSIQRGTNPVDFAAHAAGNFELDGEIDDISIYAAAVPPVPSLEVRYDDRLMLELPFPMSLEAIVEKPAKGTANGAGRILLYKPLELSRGIDRFTYDLTTTGEKVTLGVNITGPAVSAKPRYQRTVIVHQGIPKQFDLEIDNPDQHPITITTQGTTDGGTTLLGLYASTYDWRPADPPISGQPPAVNFIGAPGVGLGSVSNDGVHVTYNVPNLTARGEVRLRYKVRDCLTDEESEGWVVIHVVRPIYLTTDVTRGITTLVGNSINQPYLLDSPDDHTNLIAPNINNYQTERYTVYYYDPGIYETRGWFFRLRMTAIDGCKHYHVCYSPDAVPNAPQPEVSPVTIKLVGATDASSEGVIFGMDLDRNAHGFEVRGLTLDGNGNAPSNEMKFKHGVISAIVCNGSNIIISETHVKGCGGGAPWGDPDGEGPEPYVNQQECFPILVHSAPPFGINSGYSYSIVNFSENIIVERCTVDQFACNSDCYVSAIAIFPTKLPFSPSFSNGVMRGCTVVGNGQIFVQAGFAPLVEDCRIIGPRAVGVYFEPPYSPIQDNDLPIVIRRNRFEDIEDALKIFVLDGRQQPFTGGIFFEDNLISLASPPTPESVVSSGIRIFSSGSNSAYITRMSIHGNVIRAFDGSANATNSSYRGLDLGLCTTDVYATIQGVLTAKTLNVDCSENVFRLQNNRELFVHSNSTIDAFLQAPLKNNYRSIGESAPELVPIFGQSSGTFNLHPTISQLPE